MNKRTKYIVAVLAVVVIVSNVMFTSKARSLKPAVHRSAEFQKNVPADVKQLRERFETASVQYLEAVKPFDARLLQLSEGTLAGKDAEDLLTEVEKATGEKERAMNDLRKQYLARMNALMKSHGTSIR